MSYDGRFAHRRQQHFENVLDKSGARVPPDLKEIQKKAPWAHFFVRVETGVFAFSHQDTAETFAGDVANVITV